MPGGVALEGVDDEMQLAFGTVDQGQQRTPRLARTGMHVDMVQARPGLPESAEEGTKAAERSARHRFQARRRTQAGALALQALAGADQQVHQRTHERKRQHEHQPAQCRAGCTTLADHREAQGEPERPAGQPQQQRPGHVDAGRIEGRGVGVQGIEHRESFVRSCAAIPRRAFPPAVGAVRVRMPDGP